jgi:protein TonB
LFWCACAFRIHSGNKAEIRSCAKLIRDAEAEYTPEARKAKLQGIVKVHCVVGANGKISEATVIQGLGMGLDESALAAVKKYRFSPATLDKKPVPVSITIEVPFELIN